MHGIARGFVIGVMLMVLMCGINFKYFSSSYIATFLLDPMPSDKYSNDSFINAFINEKTYDSKEWKSSKNGASKGEANATELPQYVDFQLDYSRKPKYLWPHDPHCSKYTVRFGMGINGAWLLSFPRSGNTWTRYLLEAASGVFTGSVYNSHYLKSLGYLGETDPVWWLSTIITKTHSLQPLINYPKRPVVVIIRNPTRSMLSYWNYRNIEDKHHKLTASIDKAFYSTAGFHLFVRDKLEKWWTTYSYALKNATRLHVVFYEKLRDNPLREIRRVLRFLDIRLDKNRLFCLSRHLEGNAKGAQRDENPYTRGEKSMIAKIIIHVNDLLKARGFPSLPDYQRYDT